MYGTGSGNSGVKGVGKSIKGHLLGGEKQKRYETIFPEKCNILRELLRKRRELEVEGTPSFYFRIVE